MTLNSLYQQMILEHNKNPRNFGVLDDATHVAHGKNPLCGDDYYLFLKVENDEITDLAFKGDGCAISKSSASLMTSSLKGKSINDAEALKEAFIALLTSEETNEETKEKLKRLGIFEGVREFPVRVKCATLIWRALESALKNPGINTEVSTE